MNIVFLGPPGSGKGTQAKEIATLLGIAHLSTGDVFREMIASNSELGIEIKSYVENGKLVPDELVSRVVFEKIGSLNGKGFLLDGYPRTVDQAKALEDFSRTKKIPTDAVVFFDVNFDELTKRLSARWSCGKCKQVYNLIQKPPKTVGKCDSCGSDLIQRPDDKAEVVQERLKVYTRLTEPVLSFYSSRPGYSKINAAQAIDKVTADIKAALAR